MKTYIARYILHSECPQTIDHEYQARNSLMVNVSQIPELEDEDGSWYTRYRVIAHGGGGIEGRTYTNSREAWDYSYSRGDRIIDADLNFTADGVLVLRHEWKDNLETGSVAMHHSEHYLDPNGHVQHLCQQDPLSYNEFLARRLYMRYTPMSCRDLLLYMASHSDLYVAADAKGDVTEVYAKLVNTAEQMGLSAALHRIIVSLYREEDYDRVMSVYPFEHVMMRQHCARTRNYSHMAEFCVRKKIHAVNVSACFVDDPGIRLLTSKGIHVYVAVCDYLSDWDDYAKRGVFGCVSSFLYEDMLPAGTNELH